MIIYIYGKDTFRSKQYLNQKITEFKKKRDPQGYNVVVLDGKIEDSSKILNEIKSSPFLAEKRLIVINNVLAGKDKILLAELNSLVQKEDIPESNIIIFWQGETLGKVKEIKELEELLKRGKYNQEFNLLKGIQLDNWIRTEVDSRGGQIDTQAITYLAQNAGFDMWRLNSLIDQLVSYKNSEIIAVEDIQLFLDEKIDDNVFNMVEAIVSNNKKQALKLLNEQRRLGEDDIKIFGLITWQFRILIEMRDFFEREVNIASDQMASKLKLHPFVVRKNMYLVKRFNLAGLKKIHTKLLEIDYKTKTGQADQSLLIDLFIQKI